MIEKNTEIFQKSIVFAELFYQNIKADTKIASDCVDELISINYGEDKPFDNSVECFIYRGTDINEISNGRDGIPPLRYIKQNKVKNSLIKPYDILIEISGGSTNQSTGRSCLITDSFLKENQNNISTSGFSKTIRCKSKKDSISLFLTLKNLYKNNVFFQYENGSNGIKNLHLNVLLNEIIVKKISDNELSCLESMLESAYVAYAKNRKLNKIKQMLLSKYF